MISNNESTKRIIHNSRLCFEPILSIMAASDAFISATQYLVQIRNSRLPKDKLLSNNVMFYIQPSLQLTFPAPGSGLSLGFDPSDLLLELANNRKPVVMRFDENVIAPSQNFIPNGAIKAPNISFLRERIIQSVFIDFIEIQKPLAMAKWDGLRNWNRIWQFAWLVRNALAHGGKINWTDTRILEVSWKNISYNHQNDNNKEIIFKDIGEGDLIILIDELDNALI